MSWKNKSNSSKVEKGIITEVKKPGERVFEANSGHGNLLAL